MKMIGNQAQSRQKYGATGSFSLPTKQTSMRSLIIWNVSKAFEENPYMDLRHAMRSAHERLERESRDESGVSSQSERHLTCALLAWQQLGHKDTDSLYQFIEENRKTTIPFHENSNKYNINSSNKPGVSSKQCKDFCHASPEYPKDNDSSNFDIKSLMGPVVKLPVETKIIMRSEYSPCARHSVKKISQQNNTLKGQNDMKNKIDAACCMDSVCVQRLAELDTAVCELRSRAARLARREAERVELLERAEAAWKDLELGYQRRLSLAEEKEDDLTKQIKKIIDERNGYKSACTKLAEKLKERGEVVEKERACLTLIEKDLCDRACVRLRLSEETARGDTALAEEICRASQMDRDRQFKEDQVRRKVSSLESEIQSARCLTQEAECAMRAELAALKEQVTQVSNQLLSEESECNAINVQLQELRKEKDDLLEDLDGCKLTCDNRMQGRLNELKKKREEIMQLKEKVIQCKCKIPQDVAVEVKRTPSLAALCQCSPEDKLLESCSCTSLRTQLLSNLLADLFGGLQSELSGSGSLMPCHLLKCLEDKHNWDRSSAVKMNLRNFFEQLLVGELDIAIATSIEKYHAKWVGASCADQIQMTPDPEDTNEGWQERVIERRAQKLATKLAEQLFQERAEQVTKKAKEIVTKGPPPCECKIQPAVYQCLVKRPITKYYSPYKNTENTPLYFKRALQDVTQLKVQVENLKKKAVKKEDLRHMEEKITKILKQSSGLWNVTQGNKKIKSIKETDERIKQNTKNISKINTSENKTHTTRQSIDESYNHISGYVKEKSGKHLKIINEPSYAVNLCLCGAQNNLTEASTNNTYFQPTLKQNKIKNQMKTMPAVTPNTSNIDTRTQQFTTKSLCPSDRVCFHKIPSNTSIERLLDCLLKWNGNINNTHDKSIICNERKGGQINSDEFNSNLSTLTKGDKPVVYSIINELENNLLKNSYIENYEKGTNHGTLPATTESEYIGAINLDKSNDNFCKYVSSNYKLKCGDGHEISYSKKPLEVKRDQHSLKNCDIDLKKESKVYSMKVDRSKYSSQFKCAEKVQNSDNNANKQSLEISGVSYVDDVLKKSDLIPRECDYCVKFLGVTLTNTKAIPTIKKKYEENNLVQVGEESCFSRDVRNMNEIENNKPINSQLQYKSDKRKPEIISDPLCDSIEKSKVVKKISDVKEDEETKCVCCDKEEFNNLEINMFTLLEEHLKEKLEKFQTSSCISTCIPVEEEKVLLSKILGKVKVLLSENSNKINCKSNGLKISEDSWKRTNGLLQEYLKVKMKRVHRTCISNNNNSETFLPVILDQVCNLIEDDFQRLKAICKCDNKSIRANSFLKKLNEQMTETLLECKDMDVQFDNSKNNSQYEKNTENTSTQVLCIPFDNKSCEVMYDGLKNTIDTAEKKVSCELKKGYITDCCCYAVESRYLYGTGTYNQCAKLLLSKTLKDKSDKFELTAIYNKEPTKILSTSEKECLHLPKDTSIVNLVKTKISYSCFNKACKLKCSRDCTFGICYCTKSLVETCHRKKCRVWKSLSMVDNSKSVTCIMDRILYEKKSKHVNTSNDRTSQTESIRNYCNVEVMTANNEHEVVLKYSNEARGSQNITSDIGFSVTKEFNKENSSSSYAGNDQANNDENYETDAEFNKATLLNSLHIPTEQLPEYSRQYTNFKENHTKNSKLENCECKKVPLCHVKMLVESIEQKLVQSKCTCDSFCSQVCPIHAKEEFNYN